jgi:hypothetical protein
MMDEDAIDWSVTTWEGNRLRQHREFKALPFLEKLLRLEQRGEMSRWLLERARARRVREGPPDTYGAPDDQSGVKSP